MLKTLTNLNLPVINFTKLVLDSEKQYVFPAFCAEISSVISNLGASQIIIIDRAFSLDSNKINKPKLAIVKDHLNLSTLNPLIGKIPLKFFAVNELYQNPLPELEEIILLGLNPGVQLNEQETNLLIRVKVKAYSYNLVLASLIAASCGKKVIGCLQITHLST